MPRILAIAIALTMASNAFAQQNEASPALAPPADLMVAKEGVFALRLGQSVDLGDKKILLSFPKDQNRRREDISDQKRINIRLNGQVANLGQGSRVDLKTDPATTKLARDAAECFLDFTDVTVTKTAPAVATFRLVCH